MTGNPILPGKGVCDPHVRIFDGRVYLYATHDMSPENTGFCMEDWWIWSCDDLLDWKHECTLRPEETYIGEQAWNCWATDAAERNGRYYWYFSQGSKRTGVMVGDSPIGPWHDPLGRPLVSEDDVPVKPYDPGVFVDDDGQAYLVFGVWEYYIARLAEDMIHLAEKPRRITIQNPRGPYGPGKLDDKPYLHKRGDIYYLSWGCFYGMSDDIFGPYDCKGSIILEENVAPDHRYRDKPITLDRHGSFFEYHGQWYFICNDMSRSQSMFFRDSSLCLVSYNADGTIQPVTIDSAGVPAATR
jgi:beta-xylosidase